MGCGESCCHPLGPLKILANQNQLFIGVMSALYSAWDIVSAFFQIGDSERELTN